MVKTICFCVFLLRGSFWSLFGIFYLFWVGLGGHLGSPWCPIGGAFALFVELVGTCGIPLGAFGHTCVALGVLLGILWDLGESFWIPWGTCWEHFGEDFGTNLGYILR